MRVLIPLLFLWPWAVAAQLAEAPLIPQLRVTVTPASAQKTHGYVQGQLILRIQLISRHPFEELKLTPPQIENADVVQLARPRTRKISGYAGEGHVHESALAVFPQDPGPLRISPVTAVGVVEPVKDQELSFDLASAPFDIEISGPPQTYDADWWIAATRAEVDESWSLPPEALRVAAPAQRKVSVRVWGVNAARLPELTHPPAQGVKINLRSAETRTEISSEGLIAFADYVWDIEVERQQVIFLKPIGVTFWDAINHRQQSVSAQAHRIEPLPADTEGLANDLMAEAQVKRQTTSNWAIAAALALGAPILTALIAAAFTALPTREDLRFWRKCRQGAAPDELYNAIDGWRVASGLNAADMADRLPERRLLSDQLFTRMHPKSDTARKLRREALAWSRGNRLTKLATSLRCALT